MGQDSMAWSGLGCEDLDLEHFFCFKCKWT